VVVIDPDDVVGLHDLRQLFGEVPVDTEIAGEVAAAELGQVDTVVQHRPQNTVGKAVVIFLVVLLGEIGDDVSSLCPFHRLGGDLVRRAPVPTPAEPYARDLLQDRLQGDFKPAGALSARTAWDRNPVGDDNYPRQYRSSQLRESRIAVRTSPAIEQVCGKLPHNCPVSG